MADKLAFELKSIQVPRENIWKNEGGFFGSDPINGEYDQFNIPNWGVKFYTDTILKKNYQKKIYIVGIIMRKIIKKILIAFGTR